MATAASGQSVNIGLYPTAVPDSFEVRMVASAGSFSSLLNASFTVRWEDSAGGSITSGDLASDCPAYNFFPTSVGVLVNGGYRYFTFAIISLEALGNDCPITTVEEPIGGFRITGLNGCRHVRLVNDGFTNANNRDYYMSVGGIEYTGFISTGAYASGACAPCTPPDLTGALATGAECITGPVTLSATATGTNPEFQWYGQLNNYMIAAGSPAIAPNSFASPYTVVVVNDCGSDTAIVEPTFDTTNCVVPDVGAITSSPYACVGITLQAPVTGAGPCAYYNWTGPGSVFDGSASTNIVNYLPGTYQLVVTNACGSDSASIVVNAGTIGCEPPVIHVISSNSLTCTPGALTLQAQVEDAGPCAQYSWTGPVAMPDGAFTSTALNAVPGIYQVVVVNPCGSDTMQLQVLQDTTTCTDPPDIQGITNTGIGCPGNAMTLQASVVSSGSCVQYIWTGPVSVPDGSTSAVVNNPVAGNYQLIAINPCGSDTLAIDIATDTTNCDKPEIQLITSTTLTCPGTPLTLQATVVNAGPCPQYIWTGGQSVPDGSATAFINSAQPGTFQLVVTNACGSDTATITVVLDTTACVPPEIIGFTYTPPTVCNGNVVVTAQVENSGSCPQYLWTTPNYQMNFPNTMVNGGAGGYELVVTNACGADTGWVNVPDFTDTAACSPPIINAINHSPLPCGSGQMQLSADINNNNSCSFYQWSGPVPFYSSAGFANVNNAIPGTYQLIFSNACGSDTAVVDILPDTAGCLPPEIVGVSHTTPGCALGNITFNIELDTAAWCTQMQWTLPGEDDTFTGPYLSQYTFNGSAGTYNLVVTNACGADSLAIVVVGADTVGCVAPTITSILGNGPLCGGDTLNLQALVTGSSTCMNYNWSGPNNVPDGLPYLQVVTNTGMGSTMYTLTVSNPCGTTSASYEAQVIAADTSPIATVCSDDSAFSLNDLLDFHVPGGVWMHDNAVHNGLYDPAVDGVGTYYYQDPSGLGCPDVALFINWQPSVDLGTAGAVTLCSSDPPVDLFNYLGGTPDPGGFWTFGLAMFGGIYNPAIHSPVTYTYRYNSDCATTPAPVYVTEILAQAWFADTDGDGFGDVAYGQLSCTQPAGWVNNSDDPCPLSADSVGTACDDGLFWTHNDAIDSTCACTGELSVTVSDAAANTGHWQLWPNPNNGEQLYISATDLGTSGTALLAVHDLLGQLVATYNLPVNNGKLHRVVELQGALAQGVYDVRLSIGDTALNQRLVVQ